MSDHHAHDDHSHGGTGTYLTVFGCLVALTATSVILAQSSLMDTSPGVAWAGMMAVSCGKAMLVIMFFMHLKWEANWKYVLTIPAMMMSVFLVCMLVPDVGRRQRMYSEERWTFAAQPAAEHHGADGDGHSDHGSDADHSH